MSLPAHDSRLTALQQWLTHDLSLHALAISPASSDASFRRYFRVQHAGGCHIAMDAPPDRENTEPFMRIAALLQSVGVNVPRIHQHDAAQGFLLLDDFGNRNLFDSLASGEWPVWYQHALDTLFHLQTTLAPADSGLPAYDSALLQRELAVFHEWFLDKRLGLALPESLRHSIDSQLIASALAQPQVVVHRDYHCRNLMCLDDGRLGVIDFQDAVVGPITYDLVSLLRDCYIAWPAAQLHDWLAGYYQRLTAAQLISVDYPVFVRWFDWMGLQRHLKVLGIFSRLDLRDGKPHYLADLPRTLAYCLHVTAQYPEWAELHAFLSALPRTYHPA